MDVKNLFPFQEYMNRLTVCNRLAQDKGFTPCTCSGTGYLEQMLDLQRTARAFVCTSDVSEDSTRRVGGAWFKRRVFTVFIIARYDVRSMNDYAAKMNLCRELFRQFHSRFLVDESRLQSGLIYLGVNDIRSRELGGQFLNGCTGLYFMLPVDEPINLQYDTAEWEDAKE